MSCRRRRRARGSRSISICRRCRRDACRSRGRSAACWRDDVVAAVDAPPFDRSNVDGFARARGRHRLAPSDGQSEGASAQCRGDRLRRCAGARSRARHRDRHRHRRRHPARRRRGGDDRADRTDRRRSQRPASSCAAPPRPDSSCPMPAPTSRAARRCCGAARASARARSACWRPAGLPSRRGAAAESRGAVDRRRTGGAGHSR